MHLDGLEATGGSGSDPFDLRAVGEEKSEIG